MAQSTDQLLSDPSAGVSADSMEGMHKASPTPVPDELKKPAAASSESKTASPKSDYSVARSLRSHKDDVDKALKEATGQ